MSTPLLSEESVRRFIDEYGKCFVGLNADEIAFHYAAPTLGIRPGEARISATNQEIRDEFSTLSSSMSKVRPLRGETALQATVRKMSDSEAGSFAGRIVQMLGVIARVQGQQRPKLRAVSNDD